MPVSSMVLNCGRGPVSQKIFTLQENAIDATAIAVMM